MLGNDGLISSRSSNDDVMDTPDGETPGERPENVDRGEV